MINVIDKVQCCGCNACGDVCPMGAITFKTDIEGFWYPQVSKEICIDCHLCEKVCPILNIQELKKNDYPQPLQTLAAINKNMRVRWNSTSGGAYTALAQTMLEKGGYVSGAIYDDDFSGVHNYVSKNPEDLERLRSSKYLQSKAVGLFTEIKRLVNNNEKVLACGTPCQMAALRSFLRKDYENLIIVDFICRGVNSPKVYRSYLNSLEKKFGSKVQNIKAKNKELGWRNLTRKVTFENGKSYYGVFMDDDFRRGYHTNVFCRPSCYKCKFKGFPRIADITLGDYWGIEKVDKNLDFNIGTSMILLNTLRGQQYFEECNDKLEFKVTEFNSILKGNPALIRSIPPATIDRKSMFEVLDSSDFTTVVKKFFPNESKKQTLKKRLKYILKRIRYLNDYVGFNPISMFKFIILNFRKKSFIDFSKGNIIYSKGFVVYDIHPTARINVNAPIIFGNAPVNGMQMPTCLKMEANTAFTVNNGPLTRYGTSPYNLRYGAYIEIINGGHLTIGQGAANVGLKIICTKEITIGNGVRIGRDVSIRDYNGPHVIINDHYKNFAPVLICDHVWLCSGCTIMPGVTIGEGAVVAANSVVTKDVPPRTLVGGNPAKVIKENVEWY